MNNFSGLATEIFEGEQECKSFGERSSALAKVGFIYIYIIIRYNNMLLLKYWKFLSVSRVEHIRKM